MKIKIAILGSTGSIGKSTIKIIKDNIKNFNVILLTANNNYQELAKQANQIKAKNLVINNQKFLTKLKKKIKNKNINIYKDLKNFSNKNKKRIDYTMCSIAGISGLQPTLDAIKFSKKVAIANKESIICGWNLINKNLKKYKTNFIPVDSEHFSIWNLLQDYKSSQIEEVIITASGGPFLNFSIKNLKKVKVKDAINHPNWKMGKKISVDSATLMNKVFEVIEALKIFNINKKKFKILIHPKSYIHAIIKFNNGLTKILLHDTDMKIPIFNSIFEKEKNMTIKTNKINLKKLNNLNLSEVNLKKFPCIKILNKIPKNDSLFETLLVSANDELVNLFLNKKISFNQIVIKLNEIINNKLFVKYKKRAPKSVNDIYKLNNLVRLKTKSLSV